MSKGQKFSPNFPNVETKVEKGRNRDKSKLTKWNTPTHTTRVGDTLGARPPKRRSIRV